VRAVDPGDFADEMSIVHVDNHQPVLSADEHPVAWSVSNDVIPAAFPANVVGVGDLVRLGCLRHQRWRGDERGEHYQVTHLFFSRKKLSSTTCKQVIESASD